MNSFESILLMTGIYTFFLMYTTPSLFMMRY